MKELHLHLDGSVRPSTVLDLYRQQNRELPASDVEGMKKLLVADPNAKDLEEVLRVFNIQLKVLQREEALTRVAYELVYDLKAAGNDYAEIRFAPQFSTRGGLTQKEVIDAVIAGVNKAVKEVGDIVIHIILCVMRGGSKEMNMETVSMAKAYQGSIVTGLDLAGDELHFPCYLYEEEFSLAKRLGVPFTIHAGESKDLRNVKDAIRLGARRLGHGITVVNDKEIMHIVKEEGILVECCLTSNLQTKEVTDIKKHPLREMFDYGIRVNINSDNMTVSDTNIRLEHEIARRELGFTEEEFKKIDQYAKECAFN